MNKLEQAARALLAHWDTPAWKYLKTTSDLMADLRKSLAEQARQNIGDGVMLTAMQHPHTCCVTVDDISEDSIEQVEQTEQAEQEPVAWHHPQCEGQCIACLIEKAVQDAYGTQGRDYMLRHINAAPVRTKDQK